MRNPLHCFLVVLAMVGLALPKAIAQGHESHCPSPAACIALTSPECAAMEECHDCPPPDSCPCNHGDPSSSDSPVPDRDHDHEQVPQHDPHRNHSHHHHHCVCAAVGPVLIHDGVPFSLHPPRGGHLLAVHQTLSPPEPPVFLLERPPAR